MSSLLCQSGEVGPDDSISQARHHLHDIDDEDIYSDGGRELTFSVSALPTKISDKPSTMISSKKVCIPPVSELTIVNQDNIVEVTRSLIVCFFYGNRLTLETALEISMEI
jgi:hypothetical protein